MRFQPSLTFNGECEAAFTMYARWFDGTITTMMTYGESPMAQQTPAELSGKILHATLILADSAIAGGDVAPDHYRKPAGFDVLLNLDDPTQAERIFTMLADGGVVHLPLQQTFWARRFGMVVDRFGIPWKINCGTGA